ncbi:hypothetical protein IWQ62_006699 [Dispira parvispora]|uniref:Uncharacterized protein n=1 Tax=Dispira parvispora TaxID=1520584 RepID=A0A9W8DYA6_9FUNG|nr:hypothetical protein IWQ62_006699 [Dispira parvispora]
MVRWLTLVLLCLYVHGTVIATSEWGGDSASDSDDDPFPYVHRTESGSYDVHSRESSISPEAAVSPDIHMFDDIISTQPHDMEVLETELEDTKTAYEIAGVVKEAFQLIKTRWHDHFSEPPTYSVAYYYRVPSFRQSVDIDNPQDVVLRNSYARYYGGLYVFQSAYRDLLKWSEDYDSDVSEKFVDVLVRDLDGEETMEWFLLRLLNRIDLLGEQINDLRLKETPVHLDEPI